MFVKPHPDRTVAVHKHGEPDAVEVPLDVLHPHTRLPMPREGMDVPEDVYWMRRLRDGDVVKAERPAAVPADEAERVPLPAPTESEMPGPHIEAETGA